MSDSFMVQPGAVPVQQVPASLQPASWVQPAQSSSFQQAFNTYHPVVNEIQNGGVNVQGVVNPNDYVSTGLHGEVQYNQGGGYSSGGSGIHSGGGQSPVDSSDYVPQDPSQQYGPMGPTSSEYGQARGGIDSGPLIQNYNPSKTAPQDQSIVDPYDYAPAGTLTPFTGPDVTPAPGTATGNYGDFGGGDF